MKIICGPQHDVRELVLNLPNYLDLEPYLNKLNYKINFVKKNYKIGVLVSGGVDSALLYYLLLKENLANKFIITPYTVLRREGSRYHALKVINEVHALLNLKLLNNLNIVGDNTLPEAFQVRSAQEEVLTTNDFVYIGIIEARDEHLINWSNYKFTDSERVKFPFKFLQKSHIIDLYYKLGINSLLDYTYSCAIDERIACGHCNGCKEREWGIQQIFKMD